MQHAAPPYTPDGLSVQISRVLINRSQAAVLMQQGPLVTTWLSNVSTYARYLLYMENSPRLNEEEKCYLSQLNN